MSSYTLLVPTCNRPTKLSRCLYWIEKNICFSSIEFKVLIADGSDKLHKKLNLNAISQSGLNIEYHGYPESVYLLSRIKDALSKVKTEYVHILGDDDFPVFEGIEEALIRLKDYNSYPVVCTAGQYLHVYDFPDKARLKALYFDVSYQTTRLKSIESKSYLKRLIEHKISYTIGSPSLFYAMYRSDVLGSILSEWTDELLYTDAERMHQVAALARGNIIYIDTPSLLRDFGGYKFYKPDRAREDKNTYFSSRGIALVRRFVALELSKELQFPELASSFSHILNNLIQITNPSQQPNEDPSTFGNPKWTDYFNQAQINAFISGDYGFFTRYLGIPGADGKKIQILQDCYNRFYSEQLSYLESAMDSTSDQSKRDIINSEINYIARATT
jgi:glycosyltransferase domain-containing protein